MIENKQQAKIAQKAQRDLYHALFGTPYIRISGGGFGVDECYFGHIHTA